MGIVLIDGKEVEVADDERLNGIEAARRAGVDIPHYCWHAGLAVVASCRMCLVETGTRNSETGAVQMVPKLSPACQTPARDGMVFVTDSDKVKQARAMVEEDLLIDHPIDCPICDKAGECLLQDYHFQHGQDQRRADIRPFTSRRREMGDTVTLFVDRCVMCTRCVRFCREVAGTNELMVVNRGSHEEIDVFPGYPLANKLSGNVVDLCPVGALGDKDFLYKQRVWFMQKHAGVCAGCSTGCSISIEQNQDTVMRLKPRENPFVNQWWMCDEGRYGYHHVHAEGRQVGPRRRGDEGYELVEWHTVVQELPRRLAEVAGGSGQLAVVVSPHLTVEEAYLLIKFIRGVNPDAQLVLGPVPRVGEEERFPTGFTIRAEKCPNRRGVEALLWHFGGCCPTFDEWLDKLPDSDVRAVWVAGGYKTDWIDDATAARLEGAELLVVQDMFDTPLWRRATYQLPGGSFAEREGSYVNYADRLQSFRWAVRPPVGAWVEGQLYWRLLNRTGLYNGRRVLSEVAAEVAYFYEAAGEIPELGIDLKLNQLADASTTGATG